MKKSWKSILLLTLLAINFIISVKPACSFIIENSWAAKASMQEARSSLGIGVVNGKLYAVGGSTVSRGVNHALTGGVVGTNEEYDPSTDTWKYKVPMPTPRYLFTISSSEDKIYCIGGESAEGYTGVNEVYSPLTDTWESKAPMPTMRIGLRANAANGKIFLIGGYDPNNTLTGYNYTSSFLRINEAYDPKTDSWETKAPMPVAAANYVSAVVDNKIYIISSKLTQIYDANSDSWNQGAPPPSTNLFEAAVATTGVRAPKQILALGLDKMNYSGTFLADKNVRVYYPANDSWAFGTNIPTERLGFGSGVVNDIVLVIGGYAPINSEYTHYFYGPTFVKYATNEQYTPFGYATVNSKSEVTSKPECAEPSQSQALWFTDLLPFLALATVAIVCLIATGIIIQHKSRKFD